MLALLTLLIALDCDRLGHPDWPTREAAERRLRYWGLLAVPSLLHAANRSESPEVRFRATQMLGRWLSLAEDYRAAAVLACPWEISPVRLYADETLRRRLHRLAIANGVDPDSEVRWLLPETHHEVGIGWFGNWMPSVRTAGAFRYARVQLGHFATHEFSWGSLSHSSACRRCSMWVVEAIHAAGKGCEERCQQLEKIAGRPRDSIAGGDGLRELIWYCDSVGVARVLREALSRVQGVTVRVREPIEGR